ncbi:MAG TPA: hypothetical protein VGK97_01820 [Spongiibacteraceae bacterium]|jgi:hypothetical protein
MQLLRRLALYFSAGTVGGLAKGGVVWCCTQFAATAALASYLANAQFPTGIYARMVWGGVAAFLFMLPIARSAWFVRGLLWGLIVSALQIVVIPLLGHSGIRLMVIPLLSTVVLSCVWGLTTAAILRLIDN